MAGRFHARLPMGRFSGQLQSPMARRRLMFFSFFAFLLIFVVFFSHPTYLSRSYHDFVKTREAIKTSPPTYERLIEWEKNLPQHNLDLPYPEGRTGRYVKFTNQIRMLGWNNVLNELLMNAHLAYESKRAYVFQDYVWKPEYYPWPESQFRQWPPHTPLNALIAGPTVGGPWDEGDNAPRSVSEAWFDVVCPEAERRIINTRDVKGPVRDSPGDVVFAHWKDLLLNAPERCIEIVPAPREEDGFPQTFDLWLWGSDRILALWDSFSKSPTSRLLATSPIVNSAVDRNEYLFMPRGPRLAHGARDPYKRMLAMHVRRGDYKDACIGLATWNSTFYSWNLFPWLPDRFTPPPGGSWGYNTPENTEKYMEHCLPTTDAIVEKVRKARSDYIAASPKGYPPRVLDVMYILSNDDSEWMDQLKQKFKTEGWGSLITSKDLVLDEEQTDVGMAVDMDIARRAAVFIGNGWSSFTSNIMHRRLADGKEAISNRFW